MAKRLFKEKDLILAFGDSEDFDERIRQSLVNQDISTEHYFLTNDTLASAFLIDAVIRQITGVLRDDDSLGKDSFSE
jgi:tRNA (guanine37-N1)-methyltransferase